MANNTNFKTLLHNFTSKKHKSLLSTNLYFITFTTFLCSLFYLLGLWHHRPSGGVATGYTVSTTTTCIRPTTTNTTTPSTPPTTSSTLQFGAHHNLLDRSPTAAREPHAPPCDPELYEYTPCEDTKRSLRFPRQRLIYRERHCPAPAKVLRCRIPAPHGYRSPLRWPASRDSVWYANVPHKELTVEKKNQNWVRFDGDRFRFPGGGTMFPRGASAYIDDIGKLIELGDGSIRTAIDTGCGVCMFDS